MKPHLRTRSLFAVSLSGLAVFAAGQEVVLKPITEGAVKLIGYYRPNSVQMTDGVPKDVKAPEGLSNPSYGVIHFQNTSFGVIIDHPDSGDYKLYVDANSDKDFTNDPPVAFAKSDYSYSEGGPKFNLYQAKPKVDIYFAGRRTPASIGLYIFDQSDTRRSQLKNKFLYYPDFAEQGSVTFGQKQFNFLLSDPSATLTSPIKGEATLLIDRKGNDKYGLREDQYAVEKPINLSGQTLKVETVSFLEGRIKFSPTTENVAEVPLPVSLEKGDRSLSFEADTLGKKHVAFPSSYKGKVVLLDFWATWCGPCMKETPNVVANYNKFHASGFEILGVSLDNADSAKKIPEVTKAAGMTWDQVCDSKFWEAKLTKLYNVRAIPQAYLVDGATGKILAQGQELRGKGLEDALTRALQKAKP